MTVSEATFRSALLDSGQPVPEGLTDGTGRPAGRRYGVYRNNVALSLTKALETGFPVIAKLIGAENFRSLAGLYLRAHPPTSPMIMYYGASFPAFLETFAPLKHMGYLGDVARLEQARREVYHAADAAPVDPTRLGGMEPDRLAASRLELAPSLRLIRSRWPIHAIWTFNMEDGAPKPQPGGQSVLITRPEFDPVLTPVTEAAARFIEALQAGQTLEDAAEAATAAEPGFDLSAALGLLLSGGAITDLTDRIPAA